MTLRLELLLSPYYDAGEMTRAGNGEPRPFPNRRWASVEAGWVGGSIATAILLGVSTTPARARAVRAIAYGCVPITANLLASTAMNLASILAEWNLVPHFRGSPSGWPPLRIATYAAAIWTPIWWYTAVNGAPVRHARLRGILAVLAAVGVGAGVFYISWRHWMFV